MASNNSSETALLENAASQHHAVPLECIFYAEFDNELGPVILYQAPLNFPAKEILSKTSDYVICPTQLCGHIVALSVGGKKIVGYPLSIEGAKYGRNKFSFNFCFVFRRDTDARPWYPLVRKIATTVFAMETESEFLFNRESKNRLQEILTNTRNKLNLEARCVLPLDDANILSLKLFHILPEPPQLRDHDVPVRVRELNHVQTADWDLAMLQILPYVDGVRYVKKIGLDAGVEVDLVKQCIRQLLYFSCVALVDIFQYSNMYTTGPRVNELLDNKDFARQCVKYVTKRSKSPPPVTKVFSLYCSMDPSSRLADFCLTHDTNALHIDDRRFITFGLIHGFICRVHEYPIYTAGNPSTMVARVSGSSTTSNDDVIEHLIKLADGSHSMDEICVALMRSRAELNILLKSQQFILLDKTVGVPVENPKGYVVQK